MKNFKELELIERWYQHKNWKPMAFQEEAWDHFFKGESGLITVPTGAGKTYAAYLPALAKMHLHPGQGLRILYITPLKALAKDLERALLAPIEDLNLIYRVERRTGDTSSHKKALQKKHPPEVLLTTPESLALLLTDKEAANYFSSLQSVIIDEWHELISSKRGVLLELSLAHLKSWSPSLQIWGLTATIGNPEEAAQVCVGIDRKPVLVVAQMDREVILESVLPEALEKLPWAGQLGMRMLPYVLERLVPNHPTLIFTNTRSQAERWYQALIESQPAWEQITALHHSSISRESREVIEEGIKGGTLSFVVCTSSLDLGVDFPYVERVIQIGSPKSIARLLQRAGRSSHKPMTPCHIAIVPTHAIEVAEIEAYRLAIKEHRVEARRPLKKCFDVLLQHLTTCAIGGGFEKEALFKEIKMSSSFAEITLEEFENCLHFLVSGGRALQAYPDFKKLEVAGSFYTMQDKALIQRHKMHIGTIVSDAQVQVKWMRGGTLGTIEESFLTHKKAGDVFLFAGRRLELVRYYNLVAHVRHSTKESSHTAVWQGSRLPFSDSLGDLLRRALGEERVTGPDKKFVQAIRELQQSISHLPKQDELLIEMLKSREGWHLFIYPFEGRSMHQGIAQLVAHRLSKNHSRSCTVSCNDYGFEILSNKSIEMEQLNAALFSSVGAEEEILELINMHEAGKSYFREIARIAGLIFPGYPGKNKSHRQVQLSSGLLYDVLQKYDSDNLLISQAKREVLEVEFERGGMEKVLKRLSQAQLILKPLKHFSPFALPLFIERVSDRMTTETLIERIESIKQSWTR